MNFYNNNNQKDNYLHQHILLLKWDLIQSVLNIN